MDETVEVSTNNDMRVGILIGAAAGLIGGAIAGYILGKRNGKVTIIEAETSFSQDPEPYFEDVTVNDLAEALTASGYSVTAPEPTPEIVRIGNRPINYNDIALQQAAEDEVESRQLEHEEPVVYEDVQPTLVNVFRNGDDTWDYNMEQSARKPNVPYIVHAEEYIAGEMGFRQSTVTYYRMDNVMCDELDEIIPNHERLMGELQFGHGSNDRNVVYIRNEKMRLEWEVLLDEGSYAHEVQGLELEAEDERHLQHSVMRMRRGD